MNKPGRNAPCPCGSGKKYKRCCLAADELAARNDPTLAPPAFDSSELEQHTAELYRAMADLELAFEKGTRQHRTGQIDHDFVSLGLIDRAARSRFGPDHSDDPAWIENHLQRFREEKIYDFADFGFAAEDVVGMPNDLPYDPELILDIGPPPVPPR